jgi:hypothetical protein
MSSNDVTFLPNNTSRRVFLGGKRTRNRDESQNLANDAIALKGLEQKLSVSGTVHDVPRAPRLHYSQDEGGTCPAES